MPAIKSSTKTGTTVVLFASERRDLEDVRKLAKWLADHYPAVAEQANKVVHACDALLAAVAR